SRRRANWAPPRALRLVPWDRDSFVPLLLALLIKFPEQINEALRHALIDHVCVHGAQLLPDLDLDLAAQLDLAFFRLLHVHPSFQPIGPRVLGVGILWLGFLDHSSAISLRGLNWPRRDAMILAYNA